MALTALIVITLASISWSLWIRRLTWHCRWEVAATLNIALQGCAVALMSPVAAAAALASGASAPSFARILGRPAQRPSDVLTLWLGILLIALAALSVQAALGLVFDARYRDFPFAPLTAATIPLLLARKGKPAIKGNLLARWKWRLQAPAAETAVAVTLAASAVYIVCNESFANWQAGWFCAALAGLAFTLVQARDAPNSK